MKGIRRTLGALVLLGFGLVGCGATQVDRTPDIECTKTPGPGGLRECNSQGRYEKCKADLYALVAPKVNDPNYASLLFQVEAECHRRTSFLLAPDGSRQLVPRASQAIPFVGPGMATSPQVIGLIQGQPAGAIDAEHAGAPKPVLVGGAQGAGGAASAQDVDDLAVGLSDIDKRLRALEGAKKKP